MRREKKLELSKKLSEQLQDVVSMIVVDYSGLSVEQMEDIRNAVKESGSTFNVIKNSVVEKAIADSKWKSLKGHLKGPNAFAFSFDDPAVLAKLIVAKEKQHKKLEIKFGSLNGHVIDAKQIEALSKLPSKDVMIAQLLATMQAPVSGFVNVLAGNIRKLMYVLKAIEEKKEKNK